MEGRGRMESGGKNEGPTTTKGERRNWIGRREGEGRGEEGISRTNVKVLPTPLTRHISEASRRRDSALTARATASACMSGGGLATCALLASIGAVDGHLVHG